MNDIRQDIMMEREQEPPIVHDHEGHCPTCGQYTAFTFLGVQRWPARLVELTGCPPETYLFTCNACNTTVSQTALDS